MVGRGEELWETDDVLAIEAVWKHPEVWPWLGDDFSPKADEFDSARYLRDNRSRVYVCHFDSMPVGVIAYWQVSTSVWEVHGGFLPAFRGAMAIRLSIGSISDMFAAGVLKIVAQLPTDNRAGLVFARRCGLRREGVNRKSVVRGGVLRDMIYLGACRDEWRSWRLSLRQVT